MKPISTVLADRYALVITDLLHPGSEWSRTDRQNSKAEAVAPCTPVHGRSNPDSGKAMPSSGFGQRCQEPSSRSRTDSRWHVPENEYSVLISLSLKFWDFDCLHNQILDTTDTSQTNTQPRQERARGRAP